jgi:predicted DNA-binding antitoxin AbrB/MazE fold protein
MWEAKMIQAVYKNGQIQPLERIPESWEEGQELVIDVREPSDDPEAIRRWLADLQALDSETSDEDDARLMAALDEQKRIGKELAQRAAGLNP